MFANTLTLIVAGLHVYFLILEMFLWTKPLGRRVFAQSQAQAQTTAILAANQGLYNGFLAAGLVWAVAHPSPEFSLQLKLFFLGCVIVAGLYGAYSVGKKILWVQALPAALAMALALLDY